MREILQQLIADSLATGIPEFARRDIRLPDVPGKAFAVIRMRRSGKTTIAWQCLADRLKAGAPRSALLYLNFLDECLAVIPHLTHRSLPCTRQAVLGWPG